MVLSDQLQQALGKNYRVDRELGGGGMSRVFLVHEVTLDRKIVVKVLPPDVAAALSVERFNREIQLAARLQHPHIVPLLTASASEGLLYYTMPFITGESLRARLARQGELPVPDVVRLLRDVVDALSYAHAEGVVHRDIKPDNVLLSGHHALVTDFGVSKALSNATGEDSLTSVGIALGTPAYMAPEQAAADPKVDHRADIYSVGALAYELLTGRPPFSGLSPQQVLAAHLSKPPEHISVHRDTVPPALANCVMRCLEKKPADRWQTADELLAQFELLATPSGGMPPSQVRAWEPRRRLDVRHVAAGMVVVVGVAGGLWFATRPPASFVVESTAQITDSPGLEIDPAISPDGKLVAYAAGPIGQTRIFVRQIADGTARPLVDSTVGPQRTPRWSRDGQQITFVVGRTLYTAPALGGASRQLFDAGDFEFASPAQSLDEKTIAYAGQRVLYARSTTAEKTDQVSAPPYPNYLVWSPDGNRLAFVSDNPWFHYGLANFGNLSPSSIWIADFRHGSTERVSDVAHLNTSPEWTPDGRSLLYVSNAGGSRDIYEQHLSRSYRPSGNPIRLTTGLNVHSISLSGDGKRLAYSVLTTRSNVWSAPIHPTESTPFSAAKPITTQNQTVEGMSVSPDGKWIVYDSNRNGNQHIFKVPVAGGEPIQLTRDSVDDFLPAWSPDGREIAYHSWRNASRDIFVVSASGGEPHRVTDYPGHEMNGIWSSDGQQLLFISDAGKRWELYAVKRQAGGRWSAPRQITNDFGYNGRWSPDGHTIAYVSQIDTTIRVINADGTGARVLFDGHSAGLVTPQVAFGKRADLLYFHGVDREGRHAFYEIPTRGGTPRLVMRADDPSRQPRRPEFDTDGERLFFTVATDESDVWLMELRRK